MTTCEQNPVYHKSVGLTVEFESNKKEERPQIQRLDAQQKVTGHCSAHATTQECSMRPHQSGHAIAMAAHRQRDSKKCVTK